MAKQRQYGTNTKKMKANTECCFYCGKKIFERNKTIDHIIPIKNGGSNCIDNLVICCKKCNGIKGKYTIAEVIEQLKTQCKYADEKRKKTLVKQIEMWKHAKEKLKEKNREEK